VSCPGLQARLLGGGVEHSSLKPPDQLRTACVSAEALAAACRSLRMTRMHPPAPKLGWRLRRPLNLRLTTH
jgi:hypothetical protein